MMDTPQVLIVDDNVRNLDLMEAMLLREGDYRIQRAQDGAAALEMAIAWQPDLLLLDVMMPGMDGFEVVRELRRNRTIRRTPVILVTALDDIQDKVRGIEAGADDFLTKPVANIELRARVNSLLKLKRYQDRLLAHQQHLEAAVAQRTQDLEDELVRREQAEAQLIQAQKLEAIGTLAGGIAHDFNNILASMLGFTEMAHGLAPEGSPLRDYLSEVLNGGRRARDLVNQILTFSRQSDTELRAVRVDLIVKEALKLLRASIPSTVEIHQDVRCQAFVMADPTHLHQVVMNLCTNAFHAMEYGGTLSVRLTERCQNAPAALPAGIADGTALFVELTVTDSGCGMSDEVMRCIFDPFFTTKARDVGTGIGLSTVHGIVEQHGGSIEVQSELGNGSTFRVFLPCIDGTLPHEEPPAMQPRTGSERILFVDDDEAVSRLGDKMMGSLGYQVTTANNGRAAYEQFARHPDRFDLIVTDLTMPHMTGLELAAAVRDLRPDIPVLLCTGYSTEVAAEGIQTSGIRAVIRKPFDRPTLGEKVRSVLDAAALGHGDQPLSEAG